jgi:hypothetical protein
MDEYDGKESKDKECQSALLGSVPENEPCTSENLYEDHYPRKKPGGWKADILNHARNPSNSGISQEHAES